MMRSGALLVCMLWGCAVSLSQNLQFSRRFEAARMNQPLAILNNHPGYFHVLRYNRDAHDIVIEKRAKPSAELLGFIPLRLDAVNASWFDYRNLDYLFFEERGKLYFIFEKVLNNQRAVYMKVADSTGRTSGFVEIAHLEADHSANAISFEIKPTAKHDLLIVATTAYQNHVSKKLMLYDVDAQRMLWSKRMPIENAQTGYSSAFSCGSSQEVYYVQVRSHVVAFERRYLNHAQTSVPVYFYDEVQLKMFPHDADPVIRSFPLMTNLTGFAGVIIQPDTAGVDVQSWYAISTSDTSQPRIFIMTSRFKPFLEEAVRQRTVPLEANIESALHFFDGGDNDAPAYKDYRLRFSIQSRAGMWTGVERRDPNYDKEMLFWHVDRDGRVDRQRIIPRKLYGFGSKTRFRYAGEPVFFVYQGRNRVLVAEAPSNFGRKSEEFNYHRFRVESNLWRANLVMYDLDSAAPSCELLHQNSAYDLVPLPYSAAYAGDVVFYFTSGRYEKFAILPAE